MRFCYNQDRWKYSPTNLTSGKTRRLVDSNNCDYIEELIPKDPEAKEDRKNIGYTDHRMESECEMNTQYTKDLLIDLKNNFTDHAIDKLISIELIQHKLTIPERILYDMYFNQQLSGREIAKRAKLPRNAANNMVNDLINKIKKELKSI